jgi:hypothetical protein
MNGYQHVTYFQNQIMRCVIFHSDITPPEILAMHTKCRKGFITYHKSSGIIAMKEHVEFNHSTLQRTFLEDVATMAPRSPRGCENIFRRCSNHGPKIPTWL